MLFPEKALVIASSVEDVENLRCFLLENYYPVPNGWQDKFPSYFLTERNEKETCYNISPCEPRGGTYYDKIGWCDVEWYHGTEYENEDPSWNYISVAEYIEMVYEMNGKAETYSAIDVLSVL